MSAPEDLRACADCGSTTTKTATPALFAAVAEAIGLMHGVGHDGKFSGGRSGSYSYASTEKLIAESRGVLASCGLALLPTGVNVDGFVVTATYLLTHRSGESQALQTQGTRADFTHEGKAPRPDPKKEFALRTSLLGYLLRDLLQIPRGEDVNDDRDTAPRARPSEPQAQPPPKLTARAQAALNEIAACQDRAALMALVPRFSELQLPEAELGAVRAAFAQRQHELPAAEQAAAE